MRYFTSAFREKFLHATFSLGLATTFAFSEVSRAEDWPEFQGSGRQNIWAETGIVDSFTSDSLPRVWSAPVGPGYSGPTVAGDKIYVIDRPDRDLERVLCFDRETGKKLWEHPYEAVYKGVGYDLGPRASVTIADGHAYSFGTMGHLHCFDASSGDVKWSRNLKKDYEIDFPIWGLTSSPLVEAGNVIVQAGAREDGACYVAFDQKTGKETWRAFEDKAGYVSPMIIE